MKYSNPVGSGRPRSRRVLVGAIAAVIGLHAAIQTSSPANGAPGPSPQPGNASPFDASGQPTSASLSLQQRDQVSVLGSARPGRVSSPTPPVSGVLTSVDTALGLSLDEAQRGHPVKALATVTYCHPQWRMLFVRGADLGTFLRIPPDTRPLRPGEVVEIEGSMTSTNGFAEIKVESLKPTGQRQTLLPKPWNLDEILNGRASCQWVQIEGRVLAAFGREGRLLIQIAVGTNSVTAFLLDWQLEQARQLLDARVRIAGVVSVQFDGQGHRTGVAVLAQEPEQVQVLQAAATNPLDLPLTLIARIIVSRDGKPTQRAHLQGVFERRPGGSAAAVRDRTGLVRVQCLYEPDLPSDSAVDVLGYPSLANGELILKDAVVLPTGSTTMPGIHRSPESSATQASLPLLEAAQAIRQLKRSEAARGYPVRLEAVVTYSDARWWSLFVQDASGGIFVTPARSEMDLRSGQRVRVRGVTAEGDFAPTVSKATFEVLGEAPMPAPMRVPLEALLTGQFDCRWVEIRGVVQSAIEKDYRCWLYVMTTQGQIPALLAPTMSMAQAEHLVDARVTLRGVAGGEFNRQGQIVAARVHVPNASAIQVDEAPPADPFAIPTRRIADLSRYQPDQDVSRRVKVSGRITSVAQDETISLQDESGGMLVRLMRRDRLPRLGEQVEILGFPTADDFAITLKDAWSRIAGPGEEPLALRTTPEEVLTNQPNARLVRINARLVQDARLRPAQALMLQAGSVVFEAVLPGNLKVASETQLAADTRLQVTGVCLLEVGRWGQVKSFRLRLRETRDLKVLSRPPWWNLGRLLWTLAGTGVLGALALSWNLLLAKKNHLLREQVLERERAEAQLQRAHAALQHANDNLEHRVAERTLELQEQVAAKDKAHAELAAAQNDLVEASRQAGMAEVATGVLHNVGNVLNSVNVSTSLIRDKLRRSEVPTLGKVRDLLRQHEADLGAFLTADPKGKLVPGFIIRLSECLEEEQGVLKEEHEQLARNVEHIKEIVAMQQNYARVSGCLEQVSVAELFDDALQMNAAALTRHGITTIRQYAEVPPLTVDKHKVLQILVNLVHNAKYALDESRDRDKRLTVGISINGDNLVKVTVTDNGVGIPPKNLTRIFSHGFTTRKRGHGFGLHSGANAAKEMGGQLTVFSEGPGKGATFTLELPLTNKRTKP